MDYRLNACMISRKPNKTIIHFREKMLDYNISLSYTIDFLVNLLVLSKRKYDGMNMPKSYAAEIQTKFLSEITEYSKTLDCEESNMLEIKLESDNEVPVMHLHSHTPNTEVLLMVTFQKIDWDEINIFRNFLLKYLTHYLKKRTEKSNGEIKQIITNLSFVAQEFLQNANLYVAGNCGYKLVISYIDDAIAISVENYTDPENAAQLKAIVDEICNTKNMHELILKYMLDSQKHLGLISSVFNNYIDNINCKVNRDNLVRLEAVIKTEKRLD